MHPVDGPVLTLDAALDGCGAGIVSGRLVLAEQSEAGGRGSSALLPALARSVLQAAGLEAQGLAGLAVTVGPGSFTGVRAALALAHGLALGAGVPVWGVTVGAAIRAAVADAAATARPVWVAVDSKRGRVFLDDGAAIVTVGLDALPAPDGPVAVAGDAAIAVVSRLALRGFDMQLLSVGRPSALGIATATPGPALPLYVDPAEARPGPRGRPLPV